MRLDRLMAALVMMVCFAAAAGAAEPERPQVARYGKVFKGGEGVSVSLLGIGEPEKNEFLLQYAGINHDWDLKIFKVERVNSGTGYNYRLQVDGGDYDTLVERPAWGGTAYQIYVPRLADGLSVAYDEAYSQRINPQHFLTDWLNQEKGERVRGAAWR